MATQSASTIPQLGEMLRYWRHERGKSQLDLSLDTGISQRHLSFVESGRSAPSRDFLSIVSDALNIPLRERNVLLLASGFAPQFSEQRIDAEQMAMVTRAIDRMLRQHEPHPALVLDRYWNVIRTNEAAPRFFGSFVDLEKRPKPRNLLDLMFDPAGSGGSGTGCETPRAAEAAASVPRSHRTEDSVGASESRTAHHLPARS